LKDLPNGLDATYVRILQSINLNYRKQVANTLKWLAFSLRPILVEELAEIFILDRDREPPFDERDRLFQPEAVLKYLPSLVTKVSVRNHDYRLGQRKFIVEIRLAHFSIKEYLISPRILEGPAKYFSTTEVEAHMHISEACLAYHLHLSRTILVTEEAYERFVIWEYVRRYWINHLEQVPRNSWTDTAITMTSQALTSGSQSLLNMVRLSDPDNDGYKNWKLEFPSLAAPLYYIAAIGAVQVTEFLLDSGCDVNECSVGEFSCALIKAAYLGYDNVVKLLVDRGADINAQGGIYGTALQAAAYGYWNGESIVQLLLDRGADVNAKGGVYGNALQAAVADDKLYSVELLLSQGGEVDPPGPKWEELLGGIAKRRNGDKSVDRLRKFQEDPSGYVAAARAAGSPRMSSLGTSS
jgi:hypothetical protein